jgi:hypothetical protein
MTTVADKATKKKTRKERAKAARPGSVAADSRIHIQSTPSNTVVFQSEQRKKSPAGNRMFNLGAVFSMDDIAAMPVVIRKTSRGSRVKVWRTGLGTWHRECGLVRVQMQDGVRSVVITLFKGANEADLRFLKDAVDTVRSGHGGRDWVKVTAPWADDQTYSLIFNSRNYADPFERSDPSPSVWVCDEPHCLAKWHTEESSFHTMERVENEVGKYASYTIEICKDARRPRSSWFIDVVAAEFTEAAPEHVASFVNDLQWMAEECRRANQTVRADDKDAA